MNWSRIKEQLRENGLSHEEVDARIDELLDESREDDEPPEEKE